jgi:hypothetical protein
MSDTEKTYLVVEGREGRMSATLTDADHEAWLRGSLEVFRRNSDGRLFELATCDPFIYPGSWEWAPAD